MKPLFDTVPWQKSSIDTEQGSNQKEVSCVLTRNPKLFFFHFPRTKVFHLEQVVPSAILWWKQADDKILAELHRICMQICSEIGLNEFCNKCHNRGTEANHFWQQKLGDNYQYLKARW